MGELAGWSEFRRLAGLVVCHLIWSTLTNQGGRSRPPGDGGVGRVERVPSPRRPRRPPPEFVNVDESRWTEPAPGRRGSGRAERVPSTRRPRRPPPDFINVDESRRTEPAPRGQASDRADRAPRRLAGLVAHHLMSSILTNRGGRSRPPGDGGVGRVERVPSSRQPRRLPPEFINVDESRWTEPPPGRRGSWPGGAGSFVSPASSSAT